MVKGCSFPAAQSSCDPSEGRQLLSLSGLAADGGMGCVSGAEINPSFTLDGCCYLLSGALHLSTLPLISEQAFIFSLKASTTAPIFPQLHLLPPPLHNTSAGCCSPSRLGTNSRHPAPGQNQPGPWGDMEVHQLQLRGFGGAAWISRQPKLSAYSP